MSSAAFLYHRWGYTVRAETVFLLPLGVVYDSSLYDLMLMGEAQVDKIYFREILWLTNVRFLR
jgi:hypothetical protein